MVQFGVWRFMAHGSRGSSSSLFRLLPFARKLLVEVIHMYARTRTGYARGVHYCTLENPSLWTVPPKGGSVSFDSNQKHKIINFVFEIREERDYQIIVDQQ